MYVAQVKAFGDTVDAVRIRSRLPEQKPSIDYDKAIDAIRSGKATIEQVMDKYPKADRKRIEAALK